MARQHHIHHRYWTGADLRLALGVFRAGLLGYSRWSFFTAKIFNKNMNYKLIQIENESFHLSLMVSVNDTSYSRKSRGEMA